MPTADLGRSSRISAPPRSPVRPPFSPELPPSFPPSPPSRTRSRSGNPERVKSALARPWRFKSLSARGALLVLRFGCTLDPVNPHPTQEGFEQGEAKPSFQTGIFRQSHPTPRRAVEREGPSRTRGDPATERRRERSGDPRSDARPTAAGDPPAPLTGPGRGQPPSGRRAKKARYTVIFAPSLADFAPPGVNLEHIHRP